jgi:hypothetical protein
MGTALKFYHSANAVSKIGKEVGDKIVMKAGKMIFGDLIK